MENREIEDKAKLLYIKFCEKYKRTFTLVSWDNLIESRKQYYINKAQLL